MELLFETWSPQSDVERGEGGEGIEGGKRKGGREVKEEGEGEGGRRVEEGTVQCERKGHGWNNTVVFFPSLQAHPSSLLTFVPPSWMVRAMEEVNY